MEMFSASKQLTEVKILNRIQAAIAAQKGGT